MGICIILFQIYDLLPTATISCKDNILSRICTFRIGHYYGWTNDISFISTTNFKLNPNIRCKTFCYNRGFSSICINTIISNLRPLILSFCSNSYRIVISTINRSISRIWIKCCFFFWCCIISFHTLSINLCRLEWF